MSYDGVRGALQQAEVLFLERDHQRGLRQRPGQRGQERCGGGAVQARQLARAMVRERIRPSPYSIRPMNPASRKKAVITSMPIVTPMTGPTAWA